MKPKANLVDSSLAKLSNEIQQKMTLVQRTALATIELAIAGWAMKQRLKITLTNNRKIMTNHLIKNYAFKFQKKEIRFQDLLTSTEKKIIWELTNAMVNGANDTQLSVLTIKSWVTNANHNKWIIILHGVTRSKMNSLYWSLPWLRMGYHVLVYDARGHGYSDGDHSSLGWWEKQDLKAVENWLIRNFHPNAVNFVGWSMGAFTILEFLKENYQVYLHQFALVDSPVDRFSNLIKYNVKKMSSLDPDENYPVLRCLLWKRFNFDPDQLNPGKGLWTIRRLPVLFMLSIKDQLTPWDLGYKVFKNKIRYEKKVISVRYDWNCGHCNAIYLFYDQYVAMIKQFLRNLKT